MIPVYAGTHVQQAEAATLNDANDLSLMHLAADSLTHQAILMLKELKGRLYGSTVVALIGPGNNGGDGLFTLAGLAKRGVKTTAVLLSERAHNAGLETFLSTSGRTATLDHLEDLLEGCDLLIDAGYGTGVRLDVQLPQIPQDIPVLAADLPSGVDANTGKVAASVIPADRTVTFGALKTGLVVASGHLVSGQIQVTDLGLGPALTEPEAWLVEDDDLEVLLNRDEDWSVAGSHKYQRGVLGLLAGSTQYPGAAILTARAAVASGLGLLRTMVPPAISTNLAAQVPESVPLSDQELSNLLARNRRNVREGAPKIGAWAMGPGMEDSPESRQRLQDILQSEIPCVIDASALAMLEPSEHHQLRILTPHAGELRSLLSKAGVRVDAADILADPIRWARWAAVAYDCVVLLKGPATICTAPDGYTLIVHAHSPELATAGSGDILTGILGMLVAAAKFPATPTTASLLPQVHRLTDLAAAGALIHAQAGAIAAQRGTVSALSILDAVPLAARYLGL